MLRYALELMLVVQFPELAFETSGFLQLVHFVNRDSLGLANDFLSLGFIPEGADIQLVADALRTSFSDESRRSNDFQVCIPSFWYTLWNLLLSSEWLQHALARS